MSAAAELFAARGPDGVSLREIAAHAGLNYGLIHQYVGSKDELLRLVIAQSTSTTAARFAQADGVARGPRAPAGTGRHRSAAAIPGSWRGPFSRAATRESWPVPRRPCPKLIAMLPAPGAADRPADPAPDPPTPTPHPDPAPDLAEDPRLRAAAIAALTLGWSLFGTYVSYAAGLDDVAPAEAHAAVQSLARRIAGI